jgi:hypothetical protein
VSKYKYLLPAPLALRLGEAAAGIVPLPFKVRDGDVGRRQRANQQPDDDSLDCP